APSCPSVSSRAFGTSKAGWPSASPTGTCPWAPGCTEGGPAPPPPDLLAPAPPLPPPPGRGAARGRRRAPHAPSDVHGHPLQLGPLLLLHGQQVRLLVAQGPGH